MLHGRVNPMPMYADPTDLAQIAREREAVALDLQRQHEQLRADVVEVLATPAGVRVFTHLVRGQHLDPTHPVLRLAATAAPEVTAQIITAVAKESQA